MIFQKGHIYLSTPATECRKFIWVCTHLRTRRRSDVVTTSSLHPSDVAGTSQMNHPKTSRWNLTRRSQWYDSTIPYWNVVTTSQENITTTSHQYVSWTSQTSLKWNGTSQWYLTRRLSGTYPSHLYNVSCKSQMKHLMRFLWYVSTTSHSYVVPTPC